METHVQPESAPNDRHRDVDGDGDPDPGLHRVFRSAEERLDSQVPLDPFEEKSGPPSRTVQFRGGQWRQDEAVGQEHQGFFGFPVDALDAAQPVGTVLRGRDAARHGRLAADHPRRYKDLPRSTMKCNTGCG